METEGVTYETSSEVNLWEWISVIKGMGTDDRKNTRNEGEDHRG